MYHCCGSVLFLVYPNVGQSPSSSAGTREWSQTLCCLTRKSPNLLGSQKRLRSFRDGSVTRERQHKG